MMDLSFRIRAWSWLLTTLTLSIGGNVSLAAERPNVVIVITDDQGYGDLACHGNPVLKTPHTDRLHAESVRLTDFHVAPTCSPTRAALLTGHWTNRTGVWHTIMGRSMLRENEVTLGDLFQSAGYTTGMFGKWHLGDNVPYRPEDRGFTEVLRHGGGGVGQTPDYWNNAYFDGSYWQNGHPVEVTGYCTDVFFQAGIDFIKTQADAGKPFLAYISTNAPHGPMHAPQEYADMYSDVGNVSLQHFFGMITNIDDNIGRLRASLESAGLSENTLFIFLTDNGSSNGWRLFNAGMRGGKGSEYDGGHRVPCFVYWPAGGLTGGRDVTPLTAHVDVVPTLLDLCGIPQPPELKFDGISLRPLLQGEVVDWPDRMLITDSQRVKDPLKWKQSAVMTSRWRLINGRELYDLPADPGQQQNVATDHPEVVTRLRQFYEEWWQELEPTFAEETSIFLGDPRENPTRLTCHDWITTRLNPWNQRFVRNAMTGPENTGYWNVNVVTAGEYEIALRRWPVEAAAAIDAPLPPEPDVPGERAYRTAPGIAIQPVKATLLIGDNSLTTKIVPGTPEVRFRLQLPVGKTELTASFETATGEQYGAYFAYVTLLDP